MTSALAALGLTPADIASPLNFFLLLAVLTVGGSIAREIRLLRETVFREMAEMRDAAIKLADGKVRVARGSEERATNAAAEITRLTVVITELAEELRRESKARGVKP